MFYPPDLHNSTHLLCTTRSCTYAVCGYSGRFVCFFLIASSSFVSVSNDSCAACCSSRTHIGTFYSISLHVANCSGADYRLETNHHANETNYFHSPQAYARQIRRRRAFILDVLSIDNSPSHTPMWPPRTTIHSECCLSHRHIRIGRLISSKQNYYNLLNYAQKAKVKRKL